MWGLVGRKAAFLAILLSMSSTLGMLGHAQASGLAEPDLSLHSLLVQPDQPSTLNLDLPANSASLVAWSCTSCTVTGSGEGTNFTQHGESLLTMDTDEATTIVLTLESSSTEEVAVWVVKDVDKTWPTVRPSPQESVPLTALARCEPIGVCLDGPSGSLTTNIPAEDNAFMTTGRVSTGQPAFITMEVNDGDTVEWQWLASTANTTLTMYLQNESHEWMHLPTSPTHGVRSPMTSTSPTTSWWVANQTGRFIARVSTDAPASTWVVNVVLHPATPVRSLIGTPLSEGASLIGHGVTTSPFDWNDTQALRITSFTPQMTLIVEQLMDGSWSQSTNVTLGANDVHWIYPYPDVSGGRLTVLGAPVFRMDLRTSSLADAQDKEAPSYTPNDIHNATAWPSVNLSSTTNASFALSVHDTVDTFLFEVEGWEDSIHFVQFTVDGYVEGLELQLWDINQNDGSVLNTDITRPVNGQLKIGLQVGRGTHVLQLRFQNDSSVTQHLWGDHVESRPYSIRPDYSLIDEGEEPWFPPSEEAEFWGSVARWFLGMLFLVPAVYLFILLRSSKINAASVAELKERLSWYTQRLDDGQASVKSTRVDLAQSLHAVAQLEWEEGVAAWGEPILHHQTDTLSMAVWEVDSRLASVPGAWPLVVGIHVHEGQWDLAALRFDAPEGTAFSVVHVEPRFLFQGEEIFLDTVLEGQRTFVLVELEGLASMVDVELNGRISNEPFAAKMPTTLHRSSAV